LDIWLALVTTLPNGSGVISVPMFLLAPTSLAFFVVGGLSRSNRAGAAHAVIAGVVSVGSWAALAYYFNGDS
jgi:hypothetical protein